MPQKSWYYGFDPPIDLQRWRTAQHQAIAGDQVLLKHSLSQFKGFMSFLDGDIYFRRYHKLADMFVDKNRDLSPLILSNAMKISEKNYPPLRVREQAWESIGQNVIPRLPFKYWKKELNKDPSIVRAPIVKIGYNAFSVNNSAPMFEGPLITPVFVVLGDTERKTFFDYWVQIRYEYRMMKDILNHNKTLLFLINQHANFTHPKLLTIPRGLPSMGRDKQMIWQYLRTLAGVPVTMTGKPTAEMKKKTLVFASASTWGYRPKLLQCVSKKFKPADFSGLSFESMGDKKRMTPMEYYFNLGTAMFGLVYKLPALLVDDFDDVTPELLRSAYVEALYRAAEFDFRRLNMNFWIDVVMNVSKTMSSDVLFENTFTRPKVPYSCGSNGGNCGAGTKRTPRSYC
eukprot:gene27822-36655_t